MNPFKFTRHLRIGVESLRRSKIRSFWTMFGIIVGVGAVITIVAIGNGIKNQIVGQIHHTGKNVITIKANQINVGSGTLTHLSGLSVSGPLNTKDIQAVSRANGVSSSSPLTLVTGQIKTSHVYTPGFVIGSSDDLPGLLNQSLAYGSYFNSNDDNAYEAVIGQNLAHKMFNEDVPLGKTISFRGHSFVVVGIFNQFTFTPLGQQADFNNAMFISNDVAENLTNNTAPTYEILARADDNSQINLISKNISSAINSAHGGSSGISVLTSSENLASNNSILDLLTKLIAGVAAISLIVAGIGIMNVMLVSVSERVREIGIRKAVGATNRQILSQFMVESTVISLLGGILGVAIAFFIDYAIRISTDFKPDITWQIVVIASGIALIVGVLFGTIPAVKAASMDPIEALRAE